MAKYTIFKTPRYCPNAVFMGFSKHSVSVGDLIAFSDTHLDGSETPRIARVLGLVNDRLPDGSDPGKDTLIVLVLSDQLGFHAFIRYVKIAQIKEVRSPSTSGFAAWFFTGAMPHPEEMERAVSYGSVCDHYIDGYLRDDGKRLAFDEVRAAERKAGT